MEQEIGSGEESHPQEDSTVEEETVLPPEVISDEICEEIIDKANKEIILLESLNNFVLAKDLKKILELFQNYRKLLIQEQTKNNDLQEDLMKRNGQVSDALKLVEADQATIAKQKHEIEKAWREADAARMREQVAQEQMSIFKEKLEKLQKESEKFTERKDTGDEFGSLSKHKEGILRERDRLSAEVEELNRRLQVQRVYTDEIEKKRAEIENKNKELYKIFDETSSEAFKEKRLIEQLRNELQEVTADRDLKLEVEKQNKVRLDAQHRSIIQHNLQAAALKSNIEKLTTQNTVMTMKMSKLSGEYENLVHLKDKTLHDLNVKSNILKLKEDENHKYRLESTRLVKSKEQLMKKILISDQVKSTLEQESLKLKNIITKFEKERDLTKKSYEKMKTQIGNVIRERELVRKDLVKTNRMIGEQNERISLLEQNILTLENEIKCRDIAAQKQKSALEKVERERDKVLEEVKILLKREEDLQDEISMKQNQIAVLKNEITEQQAKVLQVQQYFETARSERNAFQKDLQARIEERDDFKERLRLSLRQNDQIKELMASKEAELQRFLKNFEKLEKEKQQLKIEIQNTLVSFQHVKSELKETAMKNERLQKSLTEDEETMMKLRKQIDTVLNEKDLIGTQLIRRNDEIALLNEKLQILQLSLDRGESQYKGRLDDIRLLKIEITNLRSQRNLLSRGLANTADMRQEVLQLNRHLTEERVKVKALEQEMTTPMNVHRWRKLKGKDPDKLDLLTKIQSLQKRVLSQSVSAVERENELQEAHKMYSSLKQFVQKLPSHKVKERLNSTQRALMARNKKMKALAAELNAKEMDEKAKDCAVDELKQMLVETKMELVKQKRDKLRLIKDQEIIHQMQLLPLMPTTKSLGAGFKMPG